MKIKNCMAVVLVFATLFGLVACGKVKSNTKIETYSEVYVEGEDGEKYTLQVDTNSDNGETEYFYIDNEDNKVVIKAETDAEGSTKYYKTDESGNKVEVTTSVETKTKVVTVQDTTKKGATTKSGTSGSSDEFLEDFSIENYTDAATTAANFILGDDYHELADASTVDVSLNSDGTPVEDSESFFEALAKKDKYTVKAVNRTESSDGTVTEVPITIIKSGDKLYFESSAPIDESGSTMTMFIIVDSKNQTCNAYIPTAKLYTEIPYSNVTDLMSEFNTLDDSESDGTYLGTVTASLNGNPYDVAMYKMDDGSVAKYYYNNGTPVRVEVKSSDGTVSITEYTISYTADESKLKTPSGYYKVDASSFQ